MKYLIFLSLFLISCKNYNYKVICPKATYYIDSMYLDGNKLCYRNSDGSEHIISSDTGKDCIFVKIIK